LGTFGYYAIDTPVVSHEAYLPLSTKMASLGVLGFLRHAPPSTRDVATQTDFLDFILIEQYVKK
jgi:hypothetical protein